MTMPPDVRDSFGPVARPLGAGETIVLHDKSGRRYAAVLREGAKFSMHSGSFGHDDLIGNPEGTVVVTNKGGHLLALRPTFAERVTDRKRRAQPIYPKDLGPIIFRGDIGPGMRVLEAGAGTGALTSALLRTVGPLGSVVSYEIREDFLVLVKEAVEDVFGSPPDNWFPRVADVYAGISDGPFDRICLDVPEPWQAIPGVYEALIPGGVLFSLSPNLSQIQRFLDGLRDQGGFGLIEVVEVLERGWTVRGRSMRPAHRMVAHTAFLAFARRISDSGVFETETDGF
ncbi:MAG TPA: tRNA (adenine-N1)-methyltransferase [Candidatus Dormibacteraeota bacterium]|jgi:tRNA (adenine57-N1/adenine58-N1)-methyltransferase|nr:tRNA (adenine-N1)-methyltransferase [Candidatus Dormibacteraeota bacterium]